MRSIFLYIRRYFSLPLFFFFNDTATTEIYTLSLHDALPISASWTPSSQRVRRYSPCRVPALSGVRRDGHSGNPSARRYLRTVDRTSPTLAAIAVIDSPSACSATTASYRASRRARLAWLGPTDGDSRTGRG